MKKYYAPYLLIILISLLTYSYSHSDDLTLLTKVLPKDCHFSSDFSQQKTIKSIAKPFLSEGQMIFSCHYGLIWQTQTPITETIIYSQKNIQLKSIDNQHYSSIDGVYHHHMATLLIDLLQANTESLNNSFFIENIDGVQGLSIKLTPKNKHIKKNLSHIIINKKSSPEILDISIENSNQPVQLSIINHKTHKDLMGKAFTDNCSRILDFNMACSVITDPTLYTNPLNP